jgi:hypothetical protein
MAIPRGIAKSKLPYRRTCTSLARACARPSNRLRIWTHLGSCGRDTRPDTCFSATSTHTLTNPPRCEHAGARCSSTPAAANNVLHPRRTPAPSQRTPAVPATEKKTAQPAGLCPGDRRHTVVEHSRPAARCLQARDLNSERVARLGWARQRSRRQRAGCA